MGYFQGNCRQVRQNRKYCPEHSSPAHFNPLPIDPAGAPWGPGQRPLPVTRAIIGVLKGLYS